MSQIMLVFHNTGENKEKKKTKKKPKTPGFPTEDSFLVISTVF